MDIKETCRTIVKTTSGVVKSAGIMFGRMFNPNNISKSSWTAARSRAR